MSTTVRDNPARHRYEMLSDGDVVGFLEYERGGDRIALTHAEVDPAYGGRGLGRELVAAAMDAAARGGLAVVPVCPYVRHVISRDPERYLGLVSEDVRADLM